jgi:hypothetical protein
MHCGRDRFTFLKVSSSLFIPSLARRVVAVWRVVSELRAIQEDLRILITDHESHEVAKRYTHHSVELLRSAVAKMPTVQTK